ncbi:MAG: UDP-N-acetylmuramate dehydrogenase [Candidatus Pacebacteria bacterium]|nr:UDP-N-acetylmuramate dehydrogenase [Candidatus Paceibacterota bacterium]
MESIKENISLKDHTTFRIGGPARYFLETSYKDELKEAIEWAIGRKIRFLVIGGGSNILFSDKGFDGLVIAYKSSVAAKEDLIEARGDGIFKINTTITLSSLIIEMKNYSGLEWAAGIPGTLGGAINGNSGAAGESMADSVLSVDAFEIRNGTVSEKVFSRDECSFGYRMSIFKNSPELLIVSAELKLKEENEETVSEKIKNNLERRRVKQPKGFSAGSVFKNYHGKIDDSIISSYPELKTFNEKGIIPAGLMIELCGLKGKIIGGAKISEEHANFIVNFQNASSEDVIALINLIKKSVKEKFLVGLEEEIKIF